MASYSFDAESFINEIKNQPYIWNYEGNKFRSKREKAWTIVARVFISDFDNLCDAEQQDVFRKLQGKWRNLRDNYVKSLKRSSSTAEYTYAKRLSFLNDVYNARKAKKRIQPNSDNSSDDDVKIDKMKTIEVNVPVSDEEMISTIDNLKRRRIERVEPVENETLEDIVTSDDDRAFFDSLIPVLREFNIDQKLEFRSEVLKLVKDIRNSQYLGVKNEAIEFVCSE